MLFFILIILIFISLFYRKPQEVIQNYNGLISPANGTIEWIKNNPNGTTTVHIFINLNDIHYQIYPCNGTIINQKYFNNNLFYPANTIISRENERFITLIKKNNNDIIQVDQIAGLLARRIFNVHKIGDEVKQGQYLGVITLGSGTEITFKSERYRLLNGISPGKIVKLGEKMAIQNF